MNETELGSIASIKKKKEGKTR